MTAPLRWRGRPKLRVGLAAAPVIGLVLLLPATGGSAGDSSEPVSVAIGSTGVADWELFARRSRRHGLCTAVQLRSHNGRRTPRGEGCGWRRPIGVGTTGAHRLGMVAYGPMVARVASVRVRFGDGTRRRAHIYPSPPGLRFHGRFWLVARTTMCGLTSVRALDRRGRTVKLVRLESPPGVDPGEPDPSACPERHAR